jgi:hypothetical protein
MPSWLPDAVVWGFGWFAFWGFPQTPPTRTPLSDDRSPLAASGHRVLHERAPPPRRTGSAACTVPPGRKAMPVAAPISGVEVKLWPCSDSRSAASGVFRKAGSAEVAAILRCEALGAAPARSPSARRQCLAGRSPSRRSSRRVDRAKKGKSGEGGIRTHETT